MTSKRLALSILLLAAACSSSSGGSDDGGGDTGGGTGPATLSAYCDDYWASWATRWAACEHGSAAAETAYFAPAARCSDALAAVEAGKATYDAARAGACLTFVAGASCDVLEAFAQGAYAQADCDAAIAGKLAGGQQCYSPESCASGICGSWPNACPSSCVTPAPSGSPCPGATRCVAGTVCNILLETETCVPLFQVGGRCMNDAWCAPGLYCDTAAAFPWVCQARKTSGSCVADAECAIGYYCGGSSTCVAWLGAGAACTQGQNACGPGLWCGDGGTCIDGPKTGEACGNVNGEDRPCIGGWCDATIGVKCAAWQAPGATCVVHDQCAPTDVCDMADTGLCTTLCAEP